jgi:cell division protein ZapA
MMRIELLGTSFQIQSDESPEYIERVLAYYTARVEEIERTVATSDPLKKAILAALLVTDELFARRDTDTDAQEIEQITSRLLARLDATVGEADQS